VATIPILRAQMFRLLKWIFRIALALLTLAVIAAIIFLLTYNSILRNTIQHEVQAQTGMDTQIGNFKLALTAPTLRLQGIKIANPPDFGGAPFLDISEIYLDYDTAAFAKKQIHIKLARINLTELDIVKNQNGQTNIFAFVKLPSPQNKNGAPLQFNFKKQTGYDFIGIDRLNISFGKVKFIDLANPQNDREQNIGIDSLVMQNVKSPRDLAGLAALIDLRSNFFFDSILGKAGMRQLLSLTNATF
jgi:uncharacterized protein involved in outer membrane biogenesis